MHFDVRSWVQIHFRASGFNLNLKNYKTRKETRNLPKFTNIQRYFISTNDKVQAALRSYFFNILYNKHEYKRKRRVQINIIFFSKRQRTIVKIEMFADLKYFLCLFPIHPFLQELSFRLGPSKRPLLLLWFDWKSGKKT